MAPSDSLSTMPSTLSFEEAAAAPLTGISAIQALTEHIKLQAGQKILILGGAGGIGTVAIQLAKHLGAEVITTVRGAEAAQYVFELGADIIIDTDTEDTSEVRNVDAVLDMVGKESAQEAYKSLKKGGILVSLTRSADEELASTYGVTAINQRGVVNTARLQKLTELIESEAIAISVEKTFSLNEAKEAFETREKGGIKGKVVITIGE
jgi:NADPH:quinone reductase-like Zn-dependent oxidoreductase